MQEPMAPLTAQDIAHIALPYILALAIVEGAVLLATWYQLTDRKKRKTAEPQGEVTTGEEPRHA